jgi:hypothetical protein
MNAKIIHLAERRPKARKLPDPNSAEFEGDEIAILALRPDGGWIWLSEDLSREKLNYLLDLLDRSKDKIRQLTVEMDS